MEEKLQAEERLEERKRRRESERKHLPKALGGEEPVEIKRKEKYPPIIKGFDEVKKTEKLDPIIFYLSRSIELKIPSLKEHPIIEKIEKIEAITFYLSRNTELKVPQLRKYHKIEHRSKVKSVLIKGEEYSPTLKIPKLIKQVTINHPSVIAPIKIFKPDATRIVIPKVRFEEIPPSTCIFLQGMDRLLEKDKVGEELETGKLTGVGVSESTSDEGETEEIHDFLDILFKKGGTGEIESGEPIVLCLEEPEGDSYIGALQTICKRIYREKKGGNPKPTILSHLTDDFKREITRWMEAKDKIFSVQLTEDNWEKLNEDDWEHISDRIGELFAQGFGFIILNNPPHVFIKKHHEINIINIEPQKVDLELKKSISSMTWGFVNLEDVDEDTFDSVFETARKKFKERLVGVGEPYISVTKRHREEESDLHYDIKLFLVKFLAKKMKLRSIDRIKDEIKVEEAYQGVYPDIFVKSLSEVYEVETLFGEGNHSIKKIDETIEKYENIEGVRKVNIVLDNLTLLRHINELMKKKLLHKYLQKKGKRSFDLDFLTLSMEDLGLMDIDKVAKKINEIARDKIL